MPTIEERVAFMEGQMSERGLGWRGLVSAAM
jgi:hypothetical protein